MSQFLQSVIDSAAVKKLLSVVGVAEPVKLDRYDGTQASFFNGNVLMGGAGDAPILKAALPVMAESAAYIHIPSDGKHRFAAEKIAEASGVVFKTYQPDIEKDVRFKALIFDASGIKTSAELDALYEFFHPVVRRLAKCARIVVLGRPPETRKDIKFATTQRALEGFTRCLAKEVGKKGCTVQLIYVADGGENGLRAPLEFFTSAKSAYVSAQVLRIAKTAKVPDYDWRQPLKDKVALVTGASRGIGEKIAETLARDGALVVGLDIPQAEADLNAVMHRIKGKALPMDISAEDAPQAIGQWLQENTKGIDIVVHNAGVTRDKTLGGMPEHFWKMAVDINLGAEERIDEYLLENDIIQSGGRIVCVSSVSGIAGNFGQTNYGTSKAGVIGMVQAMAPGLAKKNITINAVAPGFIETQMTAAMPVMVREVAKRINTLGQPGQPVDVAETIAFYANPGSQAVNGNIVRVCGAQMIGA